MGKWGSQVCVRIMVNNYQHPLPIFVFQEGFRYWVKDCACGTESRVGVNALKDLANH